MTDNAPSPAAPDARQPYTLRPVACRHLAESRRLIGRAGAQANPWRAALLGAGPCSEIPLAQLATRFEQVLVNDIDASTLERALADVPLEASLRAKISLLPADLTGLTEPLLAAIDSLLNSAADASEAIEQMSAQLDAAMPATTLPLEGRYDMLVASCVLSQLHFGLAHGAEERFARRFADAATALRDSPRWTAALASLARRMEHAFLDALLAHLADEGRIYLSESVQMCNVELTSSGQWQSTGTFRMLRTTDLADYLDSRFEVVERGRWPWVVWPPRQPGQVGRLFDVQAVVLRASRR